jgi:5-methylcytosine-specific restriction protein A
MPSYNCKHSTCSQILPAPGYCDLHKSKEVSRHQAYDRFSRDLESKEFYGSKQWLAVRGQKLRLNPVCEDCRRIFAHHVHHNFPIKTHPALRLELKHLIALCHSCHSKLEAKRRREALCV